jgi:hypothetical protein
MSDNTDESSTNRRSSHVEPPEGETVPPPVPPRPELPGESDAPQSPADESIEAPTALVPPKRKRFGALAIAVIVIAVVAVGGWVAFGLALAAANERADELASVEEQLEDTERDLSGATIELTEVTADRDRYKDEADAVAEREEAVVAKEAELAEREAAVKATEEYQKATTLLDGYTYTVGLTMEAGTYRANSSTDSCYWAVYRSGTNYDDIVDNGFALGAVTITVTKGQDFTSNRCGDWTKVG